MQKSSTKIIFFGTSDFAVPALETLVKEGYEIVTVITNPDKPVGRKKILTPPPVKLAAQKLGLLILQPPSLKDPEFLKLLTTRYSLLTTNVGIVAAYGKLIPPEILNLPKYGLLNIHPSLLPKYRGPSPIQTAILNGDEETGVTIMKVDEEMDRGEIISNIKYQISKNDNYQTISGKLAKVGAELLIKILPDYLAGRIKPRPQDHSKATYTNKFTVEDGEIKPTDTAEQSYNKIRAFNPEPGAYTWLGWNNKKARLKILEAQPLLPNQSYDISSYQYGQSENLVYFKSFLALKLNGGYIILKTVQPEGKKPMTGEDFARGYFKQVH